MTQGKSNMQRISEAGARAADVQIMLLDGLEFVNKHNYNRKTIVSIIDSQVFIERQLNGLVEEKARKATSLEIKDMLRVINSTFL